ncbi:MAG: hypothetical protein HY657_10885 [Acidobacteria bacterium]|nr:hypothetical protein [Acidobacteriota bacterium]
MRTLLIAIAALVVTPVAAQVQTRPTDPPLVTAINESWYRLGEPIQFAGELYYPAGATVFFNGNTMVRTGHYNGVPLYADTTVEPFSVLLVPVSRGLMQPYARRGSERAGTPGMAAAAPTAPPLPLGAISVFTPERVPAAAPSPTPSDAREAVGTTGRLAAAPRRETRPLVSVRPPESNDGVWIRFAGGKWVSAGAAIPFTASAFRRVGEYVGFPVYARRELDEDVIYLPTRPGLVAPMRILE